MDEFLACEWETFPDVDPPKPPAADAKPPVADDIAMPDHEPEFSFDANNWKWGDSGGDGGRQEEPDRYGVNGGRERKGISGGSNRDYYKLYYKYKGKGKGKLDWFKKVYGEPPSQGGSAFHERKKKTG